jgi:hypothetical protein
MIRNRPSVHGVPQDSGTTQLVGLDPAGLVRRITILNNALPRLLPAGGGSALHG